MPSWSIDAGWPATVTPVTVSVPVAAPGRPETAVVLAVESITAISIALAMATPCSRVETVEVTAPPAAVTVA